MPKSNHEPAVTKYLVQVGVCWPTNMDTFNRHMSERYGKATVDRMFAALGEDAKATPEFYARKNQSLRLSLDLSFQMDGNFYGEYLSGVVIEHQK